VAPFVGTAGMKPDGIHWGWDCHAAVGRQAAALISGRTG
jgi:hypothetical protein